MVRTKFFNDIYVKSKGKAFYTLQIFFMSRWPTYYTLLKSCGFSKRICLPGDFEFSAFVLSLSPFCFCFPCPFSRHFPFCFSYPFSCLFPFHFPFCFPFPCPFPALALALTLTLALSLSLYLTLSISLYIYLSLFGNTNVPLILKVLEIICFVWGKTYTVMGHFLGFFEGASTFLTPKFPFAMLWTI